MIRHVRAVYLQDWIVDPQFPLVWRLQKDRAGSGALGDIGAHIIDLTQYVTGQRITGVSALTETFVKERPLPAESSGLARATAGDGSRPATAPDAPARSPSTTRRCSSPGSTAARWPPTRRAGSPPAARTPCGSRSTARSARVVFDLERLNELEFYDATRPDRGAGLHPDPGDRAGAPVPVGLVAARPHHRLRALLHPPDARLHRGGRHRRRPAPVVRRRAAGPARAGRGGALRRAGSSWTEVEPALAAVAA